MTIKKKARFKRLYSVVAPIQYSSAYVVQAIPRRDFMISAFRMGTAASGRGLCDIDRAFFEVVKSRVKKKFPNLARGKYTDNLSF